MSNLAKVEKPVKAIVKRGLASTTVIKINMYEEESSYDGEQHYCIDIIFDSERPPRPEDVGNTLLAVRKYLWSLGDLRWPMLTFLTPEDAVDYYDPVQLD